MLIKYLNNQFEFDCKIHYLVQFLAKFMEII